jgi:putative ATP-dependent endonuclease of OLD family
MHIESLRLRNFRCFGDEAQTISFDPALTAVVGANGAGKTAIVAALQKLFATRAEDRRLTREDVHFGPGETPGTVEEANANSEDERDHRLGEAVLPKDQIRSVDKREVEIEVILGFPELSDGIAEDKADSVPEIFRAMSSSGPGQPLKARIRLEASWIYGIDEDDISSQMFWITSLDEVPFGERDIAKLPFSSNDRRRFQIRYLPATRDGNAILKLALREMLAWLERHGNWEGGREPMAKQWEAMQNLFDAMPAIKKISEELSTNWGRLFEGRHLRTPRLTVLARELQRALRELSLTLGPGPGGRHRSVHELSEGQASLFYIAIVVTLFKLDEELARSQPEGFLAIEVARPWLTIIALEEPENHLAPFYLSRMVNLMREQAQSQSVMAILTTHSASALRRVDPEQVRYVRQDPITLTSSVKEVPLPESKSDARKFIQEAVASHPELYFARLVILGEGRSEEIVLPRLARSLDSEMELDPAFVAFVPLGGRHVNHFWRLLDGLKIPYVTLLDYDLGRSGAGPRRLKYAADQLEKIGVNTPPLPRPGKAGQWDTLTEIDIGFWMSWLRFNNVFYSSHLDLDMMMVKSFPDRYGEVASIDAPDDADSYKKSVFGKDGLGLDAYQAADRFTALELAQYDALFKSNSKPVSHVEALSNIRGDKMKAGCPEPLVALFGRCRDLLSPYIGGDF